MRLLYIDIETAPILAHTWTLYPKYISPDMVEDYSYILSFAAMWEGEREVMFYSIKDEAKMRQALWDLLEEADAVVHYNGTQFDIKHINREFLLNKMAPPSPYAQVDLLKVVRKHFKFESNKLNFICQRLGLGGKEKHAGIQLWFDCMEGKEAAWKKMERYNKKDVKLTRKLYKYLLPWIHTHPNMGMWVEDPTRPTCTNCGSTNVVKNGKQYNTTSASYDRYRCKSCGTNLRSRLRNKPTSENVLRRP